MSEIFIKKDLPSLINEAKRRTAKDNKESGDAREEIKNKAMKLARSLRFERFKFAGQIERIVDNAISLTAEKIFDDIFNCGFKIGAGDLNRQDIYVWLTKKELMQTKAKFGVDKK